MSIGFAVFLDVLTISSTIAVTPNEGDFKVKVYGLIQSVEMSGLSSLEISDANYSDSIAYPNLLKGLSDGVSNGIGSNANIDNASLKNNNITADFNEPLQVVNYVFLIKNVGAYTAYLDITNIELLSGIIPAFLPSNISCIPGEGATALLVEAACDNMIQFAMLLDSSGNPIDNTDSNSYTINSNSHI